MSEIANSSEENQEEISTRPLGETSVTKTSTSLSNVHVTSENLSLLASLVPASVIRYHLEKKGENRLASFSEEYEGAVLFADISGFSSLAEKLAKDLNCAANAAESLSSYIGQSLEKMVLEVCSKGGDVIKFAGDAILTVFPASKFANLNEATLCCVQVGLNLLKLDLKAGGVQLSVHCGVGAGKVISYHVGGRFDRWEYVITGDPIEQIGSAEPEASAGEVVIAKAAYHPIAGQCKGAALPSGNFRVDKLLDCPELITFPLISTELQPLAQEPNEMLRMQTCLRSYVPRPVLQALDAGQSLWFSELRLCSTLFCRLKGLQFKSTQNLDLIHRAVCTVQKHVYAYEGTLCRFIVDDKGAGLLLAFGLPPFMHENDPIRATKSAMDICTGVSDLINDDGEPLSASIGVTSGRVFCGTTGGRVRCEYTMHGTLVNLAARYMVAAKTGVLCGQTTYREACQQIEFGEPEKLKVKGKEEEVLVYRPLGSKMQMGFDMTKTDTPLLGRKLEIDAMVEAIRRLTIQADLSEVIIFTGDAGIGKSRLMEKGYSLAKKHKCSVLYGKGLDTESATVFYLFRGIFSQLIDLYFTKVIQYKYKIWVQISNQGAFEGIASTFSHSFSEHLFTKYLTKAFFEKLDNICRPDPDDESDDVDNGEATASADFLKYMGLTENPSATTALPSRNVEVTVPPLESLPESIRLCVVRDMIPVGKDNLEEMYPLLNIFIPKIVQSSDTEATAKMRKEVRAENRVRLIKEIFSKVTEELEAIQVLHEDVAQQLGRQDKAMIRLGVQITEPARSRSSQSSVGSNLARGLSATKPEKEISSRKRRGRNLKQSRSDDGEDSTSSLGIVKEGLVPKSPEPQSPETPISNASSHQMHSSYKMRIGGNQRLTQRHDRLVLLVEDCQFVDPLSLRLLQDIAMSVKPMLIMLSLRSLIFIEDDLILESFRHVEVGNLSREEIREGMCKWLQVKEVPDKALSAVMEKSYGHPLFSEELTKLMVAEGMILVDGSTAKLSNKAQNGTFGLPDTVSALMTSKLDRLKPSQQLTLKVAAVIGAEFQRNELAALMPITVGDRSESGHLSEDADQLSDDISALVAQGLLSRDPLMMYHYRFTNAMLRESAYNLLLYQNRKDLHQKLAEYQEARNKDYLEPVYFLLATHYYLAEEYAKAIEYSELAGKTALEAHAMQQVLVCFSRLIEMDLHVPEVTVEIPLVRKIGWKRRVGEALLSLGKVNDAEEYFFAALEDANLYSGLGPGLDDGSCFDFFRRNPKLQLVKNTLAFQELIKNRDITLLLEASTTYELLSQINHDRTTNSALEYRLNALDLARAAENFIRESENIDTELLESATARLARTYAYVAVFYVCVGSPAMLDLARDHIQTATLLIDTTGKVEDSVTQTLVRYKSAKFALMVGELKQASDRVRKALWMCKFLNFERMMLDCHTLSLAIQLFMGRLANAKRLLESTVADMSQAAPNYVILAIAARTACLAGDFKLAESCLERIGRMNLGQFSSGPVAASKKLMMYANPEIHIALALLLSRKYGKQDIAATAAIRGIEALQSEDLTDLSITKFHTAAFLLTALAEGLSGIPLLKTRARARKYHESQRMSLSQIIPFEDLEIKDSVRHIRRQAKLHLKRVMSLLRKYVSAYSVCQPHVTYCSGLYQKILRGSSRNKTMKTFLQAADEASAMDCFFIKGLALFEAGLIDPQHWVGARAALLACGDVKTAASTLSSKEEFSNIKDLSRENLMDAPYELNLIELPATE